MVIIWNFQRKNFLEILIEYLWHKDNKNFKYILTFNFPKKNNNLNNLDIS